MMVVLLLLLLLEEEGEELELPLLLLPLPPAILNSASDTSLMKPTKPAESENRVEPLVSRSKIEISAI